MSTENKETFDVAYIIGSGRSGSTLLSHIMGAHPDFENIGEVYNYGHFLGLQRDRVCSNGDLFLSSPFWATVRANLKENTGSDIIDLKRKDLATFEKNNLLFFEALRAASTKRVFVDSSKRIYRFKLLQRSKRINLKTIHLVKDPRGYAYNNHLVFTKTNKKDHNFLRKLIRWNLANIYIKMCNLFNKDYILVRYEDFCKSPVTEMQRIMQLSNANFDENQFNFWATQQYAFSGNTRMVNKGAQEITWDSRYVTGLPKSMWITGTLISFASLLMFNYPLTRSGLLKKFIKK